MELISNKTIRQGAYYTFFSVANKGLSFLLLLLLAALLSPDQYGKLSLFTTLVSILIIVIPLGTNNIVTLGYFRYNPHKYRQMISATFWISIFSALAMCMLLLGAGKWIEAVVDLSTFYVELAVIVAAVTVIVNLYLNWCRSVEKIVSYGVFNGVWIIGDVILTIFFVYYLNNGWQGRIYGQLITTLVVSVIGLWLLSRYNVIEWQRPRQSSLKEVLAFGLPLLPHNLANWLRFGMDRYIINYFFSATEVGYYSFAFNLAAIISTIGLSINLANSVSTYKAIAEYGNKEARTRLWKQTRTIIAGFILLTLAVCSGSYIAIPWMFPKYSEALPFVIPLALAAMFQSISLVYIHYIYYHQKTRLIMSITVTTAMAHLIAAIILTRISPIYTAWIYMISSATIAVLMYFYSRKDFSQEIAVENYPNDSDDI